MFGELVQVFAAGLKNRPLLAVVGILCRLNSDNGNASLLGTSPEVNPAL